ncbi:MarR family transcriptional regulator [Labrys sp. LIt4]|uniref:MarR family transcriptional regulator n=1 Tax=Labrys okinawensis TaxID=346911 RepID=A0A2S9QGC3_9HYPH|nr:MULTISPECIES: MarR family transcriptional regulator [Labrys]MBP0579866.1 MarR family transcriptional regulator [Labrys sp. LIt4]PRH88416.1 MarR family transcriptional regulator [Labrys okinawensis]
MEPSSNEFTPLLLQNQLCFALYAANNAFGRSYKPLLDPLGLTYPQYLVMLCLWERDGLKVGEIGARLFLETNTLTPLLKRLEAAGLLKRRRDSHDERQVRISLTAEGKALREKARIVPSQIAANTGLEAAQAGALKDWLEWLREALDLHQKQESDAA